MITKNFWVYSESNVFLSVSAERASESSERASSRASFSFALFFSRARESREVCVSYSAIEGVKREREREGRFGASFDDDVLSQIGDLNAVVPHGCERAVSVR